METLIIIGLANVILVIALVYLVYGRKPLPLIEVKTIAGNKYKVTITAEGALRIKVPYNGNTNLERAWISRCKKIAKKLAKTPYSYTLRSEAKYVRANLVLRQNTGKKSVYHVEGTTLTYIKKETDGNN